MFLTIYSLALLCPVNCSAVFFWADWKRQSGFPFGTAHRLLVFIYECIGKGFFVLFFHFKTHCCWVRNVKTLTESRQSFLRASSPAPELSVCCAGNYAGKLIKALPAGRNFCLGQTPLQARSPMQKHTQLMTGISFHRLLAHIHSCFSS